jgi:hypothetical protein
MPDHFHYVTLMPSYWSKEIANQKSSSHLSHYGASLSLFFYKNEKKQKYEQKGLSGEFTDVTDVTLTLSFGKNKKTWTHLNLEK